MTSIVTFVQRATSPHLFYGIWRPVARTDTPTPFGPFLNRNDLATWLLLALPLVAGYVAARVRSHGSPVGNSVARVEEIFDSRMVVLLGALDTPADVIAGADAAMYARKDERKGISSLRGEKEQVTQ